MSKRKHNRADKRKAKRKMTLPEAFFGEILPFIEKLEKEDQLLLVVPLAEVQTQGIVIGDELSAVYTQAYVEGTRALIEQCGSVEAYFDRRLRNPKWYAKHNPDQQLLTLIQAARMVISYRYAIQCGEQNVELQDLTGQPLFITMMQYDGTPSQVGYELNGIITLEQYDSEENETAGSTTVAAPSAKEAEA